MSDSGQSGAVRLQAVALIAAAFVTTAGAVTSAFIQSGWIKPAAVAVAVSEVDDRPLATFTGTIEPVELGSTANEAFAAADPVHTENRPAAYQEPLPTARLKPSTPPASTYSKLFSAPGAAPALNSRPANAPRILSGTEISKPLMATGSWMNAITPSILTQSSPGPTIQGQPTNAPRANGRPANWTPLPH